MSGRAEALTPPMLRFWIENWNFWLKKNTDWAATMGQKVEEGVDYALALATVQIEVKNSSRDGTLQDKPTEIQTKLLDKYGGFIFLVMWDENYPRLPKGADAYLVPWEKYKEFMVWTNTKGKSIRRYPTPRAYGTSILLSEYKLEWANGHFDIPYNHPSGFWMEVTKKIINLQKLIDVISAGANNESS